MKNFKPCQGKTACGDDGEKCLVCGRGLEEIEDTRPLIDALAELAIAHEYANVGEYLSDFLTFRSKALTAYLISI